MNDRERHQPNYSILQFVSDHEQKSDAAEPYYLTTSKEHFKAIYFEISMLFITH